MKKDVLKVYVITLSRVFPATHPKAGKKTYFKSKLEIAHVVEYDPAGDVIPDGQPQMKLHTMRANWELWAERFEEIYAGKACISLRQWTGKPYASKQVEIARLTREDGIGMQTCCFTMDEHGQHRLTKAVVGGTKYVGEDVLAMNDGLTLQDWRDWLKGYDLSQPMAIIQLTKFRY